jgi:hypothetical protein
MENKDGLNEKKIRFEEKKGAFVADFNAKIAEIIKKTEESIAQYTEARNTAIKLADPIDLKLPDLKVEFKTVGELFAWVYYKEGSERIPMEYASILMPVLSGRDASDESKAAYKTLHKTYQAQNRKNFYEELNRLGGGLAWFNTFMNSALTQMRKANLRVSGFKDYDEFEEAISDLSEYMPENLKGGRPQGVLSNLYAAFIEYDDTPKKSEETPAPINEPSASSPTSEQASSINEGEKGTPSPEKSVINPNPVKPTESENIEKTSGTVVAANPTIPVEAKEEIPPSPINVDVTVPEQPAASPSVASSSVINEAPVVNQSETSVSNTTNSPINVDVTTNNSTASNNSSEEIINNIRQRLEKIKASQSTVNDLKNTSVKNTISSALSDKLESSTTSNVIESSSGINEKTINKTISSVLSPEEKKVKLEALRTRLGLNSEKITNSITSNITSEKSSEEKNTLETNTTEPTLPTAPLSTALEVSKTSPMFSEKTKESSSITAEKTNMLTQEAKPDVSLTPVTQAAPAESPTKSNQTPEMSAPSVNIDMSMLEQRLSRLEYLLSGTLDVRIVN